MKDIPAFHQIVGDLLRYLGFSEEAFGEDREVVSLRAGEDFSLHFGVIDAESWFMLAVLDESIKGRSGKLLSDALRLNQMVADRLAPSVSLDDDDCLCCWQRLHLREQLPLVIGTFDVFYDLAERLYQLHQDSADGTEPIRQMSLATGKDLKVRGR